MTSSSHPPTDGPAAPAVAPAAALDATALARLQELDPTGQAGVLRRVLSTFDTSLANILQGLERARDAGDSAEMRRLAHTLKSSSASVGALTLSSACAKVEALVREQSLQTLPDAVALLLAEGRAAQQAVRRHLAA